MSSTEEIGAPFTLASVPASISAAGGRTQASAVCSISGTKKRKRTEVAVGVDGEGIFVYSLQNPQLVTSYALPPDTSFATAPYCVYRKRTRRTKATRFTYAAVTQTSSGQKPQLLCFEEEIERDGTTETTKTSYVQDSGARVKLIDSIPVSGINTAESGSHEVVVVLADGSIQCFSSDLKTLRWTHRLRECQDGADMEYASVTTAKTAIAGLLRNRQDIAAILAPTLEGHSDRLGLIPIVCVVYRQQDSKRFLGLWQLQPRSPDIVSTQQLPVKHLVTWGFPVFSTGLDEAKSSETIYLHASTGILHQLGTGNIFSYDFSGTVPTFSSKLSVPGMPLHSLLRISTDVLFATSDRSVGLFDVHYNSVQSLLPYDIASTPSETNKKRKHTTPNPSSQVYSTLQLIAYFAETGLAVAFRNDEIIGFQLSEGASRKKRKDGGNLLIHNIGKGISSATARDSSHGPSKEEWQKRVHKLDKYVLKGKILEFERSFAHDLGLNSATNGIASAPLTNGATEHSVTTPGNSVLDHTGSAEGEQLQKWQIPASLLSTERHHFRHLAMYALSKIFNWRPLLRGKQSQSALEIDFFPPNVFEWLLLSGYITKESIRRALQEYCPEHLRASISVSDGDIIVALVNFDPDLHLLSAVLNHAHFLPIGEVVQSIKVLMQSLNESAENGDATRLLTNGAMTEDEMDVDLEIDAATQDVENALKMLDNGLPMRSLAIRPALIRLHTFPASTITTALRSTLSRAELETLIRVLHSEFRNGGWTSQYDFMEVEAGPDVVADGPDDQAVAIITSLLSCALDAIGSSAWLSPVGGPRTDDSTEDIVQDLLHDTSEALTGFWEASYINGLLGDFLRFASSLARTKKPTNKRLQEQGKPYAVDLATSDALPIMPMGGKVDLGIEKTKPGKGGKREERSARDVGDLISRRVPKYTLERIVI